MDKPKQFEKVFDRGERVRGLWKRGERFYAQVTTQDTEGNKAVRRVPLEGADTVAAARQELNKLIGKVTTYDPQTSTFAAAVAGYREWLNIQTSSGAIARSTVKSYLGATTKLENHFKQIPLNRITTVLVNEYRTTWQKNGLTNRTINVHMVVLHGILKFAKDEKALISTVPNFGIKPLKHEPEPKPLLKKHQVDLLIDTAAKFLRSGIPFSRLLRFLASSGMRIQEAQKMRWDWINWEMEQINLPGRFNGERITKSGKSRNLDFNQDLKPLLLEMKTEADAIAEKSAYLWPSPYKPETYCTYPAIVFWSVITEAAKTDPSLTTIFRKGNSFHLFRHYFISKCVMAGIDWMTVARWVGHQDGGVLIGKVYGHLDNDHGKRMAAKL